MAKQTRQQRRERRAETADAGRTPPPRAPRTAQAGDGDGRRGASVAAATHTEERRRRGGGLRGFVGESVAELKKVEWPTQKQVITGTTVVLLACVIVGVYLYANDIVWKHVVKWIVG